MLRAVFISAAYSRSRGVADPPVFPPASSFRAGLQLRGAQVVRALHANECVSMHAGVEGSSSRLPARVRMATHVQGGGPGSGRRFACRRMRFAYRRIDAPAAIVMVDGRSGLFPPRCRKGRRACAVLRNRACTTPKIRDRSEARRQSAYTFAGVPATCTRRVAASPVVRAGERGLREKPLVSCTFSNDAHVMHACRIASTAFRCATFAGGTAASRRETSG